MSESRKVTGTTQQPAECDRESLAGLMSLAGAKDARPTPDVPAVWSITELAAIWRHQLAAPLLLDLGGMNDAANATVAGHTRSGEKLQTFADLVSHPRPPIDLLQLAKGFAKSRRHAGAAVFPVEIASTLYYLAIVLADLRLGLRITKMDDSQLHRGVQWCLQQPWIDPATRELFDRELRALSEQSS